MAVAELRGLFASVIHEGPPEPAQLRGLFASVIHEGPPEAAQLRGMFASVIHSGYAPAVSGLIQLPGEDRRPLVGNFARGRKQTTAS